MSTLLVQSCSKSKIEPDKPVSALELYSGYFFKIIKKSMGEGGGYSDCDLCILSAKHGIIDPEEPISPYDRRMDSHRAKELGPKVRNELKNRVTEKQYKRVVINAGKEYRRAIDGFDEGLDVETYLVQGDGIGLKGRSLKQFLQGEESGIRKVN
ncbi:DUF6884 domain-containing protein [Halovivax gelatinilyticus]|uniref:DUF6884 domain-containing protein n=1 Tax=Halovivax gelatinilyticus TaxID=2961597 RepID=UPI0020CA9027|nr:DUF6884 domain-containing protein [Halovivax gelatinilyticus]